VVGELQGMYAWQTHRNERAVVLHKLRRHGLSPALGGGRPGVQKTGLAGRGGGQGGLQTSSFWPGAPQPGVLLMTNEGTPFATTAAPPFGLSAGRRTASRPCCSARGWSDVARTAAQQPMSLLLLRRFAPDQPAASRAAVPAQHPSAQLSVGSHAA
jgi:hypothetical protein